MPSTPPGQSPSTPSVPSRRSVLRAGGLAAGLAATGSLLPASVHRAMAAPMRKGGVEQVEHVILLMQENRSFDHYYGTLRGVRGFGDAHPLRRRGATLPATPLTPPAEVDTVMAQPGGTRDILPFSVRQAAADAGRPASDIEYLGDLPHGFGDATGAWADGWWDRWVPHKSQACMTYYDRSDVPLQYELAETFTTLDAYHCSVYGSTNPNRNYFWSGTTGFEPGSTTARAVTNAAYSYSHKGYDWTTYPERLEAAGVSWQIYQEWDNFTDNAVEYFAPFKAIGTKMLAHVEGGYRTTEEFYDSVRGMSAADQERLLAQLEAGRAALTTAERALFDKAMFRSRPGTLLERVQADIAAGTLPKVTWLVPTAALSEHPGASTPVGSAGLIHDLLDTVASDLDTWSKTAILVNFDENDGFFDHVPAPTAPRPSSGNDADWYDGRPIGLGPRVPMTIVSPWTVGGFVDSSVADHTSTLRFLEKVTGVAEPNISTWRRDVCSDLTSAFDFRKAGTPPQLAQPDAVPKPISRWRPAAPASQSLPEQEPGRRPARPLGYQPSASVAVSGTEVAVTVRNAGDVGEPALSFTVYPYAAELARPTYVTVRGGESATVAGVPVSGTYDLVVQGPNRFWAEASGSVSGAAAGVSVAPDYVDRRPALGLVLTNTGSSAVTLRIAPLAFKGRQRTLSVGAGARLETEWPTDNGWYDLVVTAAEDVTFRRRVTGRVETGRRTTTP